MTLRAGAPTLSAMRRGSILALTLLGCSGPATSSSGNVDASDTWDASASPSVASSAASALDALAIVRSVSTFRARLGAAHALERRSDRFATRHGAYVDALGAVDVGLGLDADGVASLSLHDDPELGLAIVPEGARSAHAEQVEHALVYRDAFDAVDVVSIATSSGLEELRIVRRPMPRFVARYRIRHGKKVASLRLRDGVVEALDAAGRTRISSDPVFAVDADGIRRDATVALLADGDEHVLVVSLDSHDLEAPFVVDPGWTFQKTMGNARSSPELVTLGTKALIVAGSGTATTAELYDSVTKTLTDVSPASAYPKGLQSGHLMVALANGTVLVAGGYLTSISNYTGSASVFDPETSTWTTKGSMGARSNASATLLTNGRVLVAGGSAGSPAVSMSTAQLYDPTAGTFTTTGSMLVARSTHCAVRLANGKVLIAGGGTTTAELYDGATFAATGALGVRRSGALCVTLANGKVLVAGGFENPSYSSTAEIYDPTLGTWTATGSLATARGHGIGARLPSGRVLFAAGAVNTPELGGGTEKSEVFDPSAGTWRPAGDYPASLRNLAFGTLSTGQILGVGGNLGAPNYSGSTTIALFAEGQLGDTEATAGDCASGVVADGVCCAIACSGQCQACNVAGSLGTCTNVTGKPVGARPTCAPYACNGAGACATSCTTDAQCDPTYYCAGNVCVAKKAQGIACTAGNQCTTSNCVDGYCCNGACGDQCARCDGTVKGTCSATFGAPVGARTACAGFGLGSTCGFQCNGGDTLACHYPPNVTPCSANTCNPTAPGGPEETRASQCDGSGGCNDVPKKCGTYVCGTNACKSTCAGEADCAPGFVCQTGVCTTGSGPTIGSSCTTTAGCPAGTFCTDNVCCSTSSCAPGSSCATVGKKGYCAKLPGSSCTSAGECGSGFCVDGVCCDRTCVGQCEACNGVGTSGTCTAVVGAPRGGRAACGTGGVDACLARACNGTSALACEGFVAAEVACRAAACVGSTFSPAATCNGLGACGSPASSSCSPYACDASACRTNCTTDTHCASGFVCSAGACVPGATKSLGDACTDVSSCPTGAYCTDGVCCTTQVCAAGLACNTAKKKGTCAKAAGIECKADAECGTGVCADGVCCDRACGGQCEACDVTGSVGTCSPVKGAPHTGRTACTADAANVCASAACDGIDRASCAGRPGAETKCREPKCEAGTSTPPAYCNGSGSCTEAAATSCGGYACDASTKACRTTCTTPSECAAGYDCEAGSCTPTANKCSDDGTTVVQPDGKQIACDATRCRAGKCIETCTLSEDCAVGYVCGGDGKCTRPAGPTEDSGGCATGPVGAPAGGSLGFVLLCLGLAARRRCAWAILP